MLTRLCAGPRGLAVPRREPPTRQPPGGSPGHEELPSYSLTFPRLHVMHTGPKGLMLPFLSNESNFSKVGFLKNW